MPHCLFLQNQLQCSGEFFCQSICFKSFNINEQCFLDTNWNASYPLCGGAMQSPINILNNSTSAANYSDFAFSVGYKTAMMGSISNTGYASM